MATASAAERTLRPLLAAVAELCWITGAGEPVGSELSLGLSARSKGGREEEERTEIRTETREIDRASLSPVCPRRSEKMKSIRERDKHASDQSVVLNA